MKRFLCVIMTLSLLLLSGCFGKPEEDNSSSSGSESSQVSEQPESSEPESSGPVEVNLNQTPPPLPAVPICIGQVVNIVEGSYANVRNGPGQDNEVIGRAQQSDKYYVDRAGSTEEWIKISYNGQDGYIYKDYFSIVFG